MSTQVLLSYDFPPMGGGIARWMGELAQRYPRGSLIVSTGSYRLRGIDEARFSKPVDRLALPPEPLRTLQGLNLWSRRAVLLTMSHRPEFIWCGNLKPA